MRNVFTTANWHVYWSKNSSSGNKNAYCHTLQEIKRPDKTASEKTHCGTNPQKKSRDAYTPNTKKVLNNLLHPHRSLSTGLTGPTKKITEHANLAPPFFSSQCFPSPKARGVNVNIEMSRLAGIDLGGSGGFVGQTSAIWCHMMPYHHMWSLSGWCLTPTLLLICSSFSKENGHIFLICSSLSTAQLWHFSSWG